MAPGRVRMPAVAAREMVATSQPLATTAGLRALERGGNAVDAALAAAAVLCVTEPMSTGVGGDLFAIVWNDGQAHGLDAAGPAPAGADPGAPIEQLGPTSVDVPGAVAGWAALAGRYGRLGLDECLSPAIDAAERGFALGHHAARLWQEAERVPDGFAASPAPGARVEIPELAATLRRIAEDGPSALYRGEIAAAIAGSSWLDPSDLAAYEPRWVEPLRLSYGDVEVLELPPPTQGVAALEGLGILAELGPGLANEITATRLALEDAHANVRDGADVGWLIEPEHLRLRAGQAALVPGDLPGGTVYLCAADGDGMAISLIQSIYGYFGSGIAVPRTGIVLNNRAGCFSVAGSVTPGARPYHTLIPGMLLRDDGLLGPFGIMGGFIQAQAHVQFVAAVADEELDPQAALDRPRFRLDGDEVALEPGYWDAADEVRSLGLEPVCTTELSPFGGGQAIFVGDDALVGGSDPRKDGYVAGR
ncbi:MAG: gamma-glutamyltransferase [Solirubrobacteraceae bacterium]